MHKRIKRINNRPHGSVNRGGNVIFHRRYRLAVRRQLLRSIVLGDETAPEDLHSTTTTVDDDKILLNRLESALLEPRPRSRTETAKILLRYCFHVADYFPPERIAPIQPSTLARVSQSNKWCDETTASGVWESLETEICKSYNRYVKVAALDFILGDGGGGKPIGRTRSGDFTSYPSLVTERYRPALEIKRLLARKLCIHHFYGRKFVALWYKFIRYNLTLLTSAFVFSFVYLFCFR